MKVLAINGSPRGRRSNTDRILQPFLEGAREAGAETETVYLRDKKINHCLGCFTCWTKTPGVCVHKDDMPELLEKIRQADVLVYATPLYVFTVSGLMKDFMDRHIPDLDPHIVKRGNQYIHPPRYQSGPKKQRVVLISNCGFPERHHFSGLVETFRCFTSGPDSELVATILCAAGELLGQPALQESLRWYTEAARRAGQEVVEQGRITPETQAVLDQPLAEPEVYSRMVNAYWDSIISRPPEAEAAPAPVTEATLSPPLSRPPIGERLPETFREVIAGQPAAFNAEAAGDLRADIQFHVTGQEPGDYVLRIADGRCTAHEGTVDHPTLTIHTPSEVWLQIARGELSGQTAYLKGLYHIEGDLGLLLRMNELFATADKGKQTRPSPPAEEAVQRGPIRLPGMAWLTLAFVPWIVHWATADIPNTSPWLSLGVPLLLGAWLWGYRRIFARPTWMERGTPLYFALAGLVTLLGNGFFAAYGDVVGPLVLGGLWMGTLATDMPLTGEYSKWYYPPALWTHPVFVRTNAVITAVWVGVYMLQAILALVGHFAPAQAILWMIVRDLLLVPAFVFTAWFQKWYPAYGSVK